MIQFESDGAQTLIAFHNSFRHKKSIGLSVDQFFRSLGRFSEFHYKKAFEKVCVIHGVFV